MSKVRRNGIKAVTAVYAAYKWFEDHVDDVERWSASAISGARGKPFEKVVVPAAERATAAARWVRAHGSQSSTSRSRWMKKR